MGLLPELATIHSPSSRLACVDAQGRAQCSVPYPAMCRLLDSRHFNVIRGDPARLLYARVQDRVRPQFATRVASFRQGPEQVHVAFSDGTTGLADVLVGADGVHAHIRCLACGEEACFTRLLGYYTASSAADDTKRGAAVDSIAGGRAGAQTPARPR